MSKTQRGIAILMALMFMAISATIAIALTFRQSIDLRLTEDILSVDSLYLHHREVVAWAETVLQRKSADVGRADTLEQPWAEHYVRELQHGLTIKGDVVDLNRYLNLNCLIKPLPAEKGGSENKARGACKKAVERLLQLATEGAQGLSVEAKAITKAISVRLKADKQSGQESLPMVSVSELRSLPEVSQALYQALLPYVAAVPGGLKLNVNTVLPEVLAAASGATVQGAKAFLDGRPYRDAEAINAGVVVLLPEEKARVDFMKQQWLTVSSHLFLVAAEVAQGRHDIAVYTLLKRAENGEMQTLWVSRGTT